MKRTPDEIAMDMMFKLGRISARIDDSLEVFDRYHKKLHKENPKLICNNKERKKGLPWVS